MAMISFDEWLHNPETSGLSSFQDDDGSMRYFEGAHGLQDWDMELSATDQEAGTLDEEFRAYHQALATPDEKGRLRFGTKGAPYRSNTLLFHEKDGKKYVRTGGDIRDMYGAYPEVAQVLQQMNVGPAEYDEEHGYLTDANVYSTVMNAMTPRHKGGKLDFLPSAFGFGTLAAVGALGMAGGAAGTGAGAGAGGAAAGEFALAAPGAGLGGVGTAGLGLQVPAASTSALLSPAITGAGTGIGAAGLATGGTAGGLGLAATAPSGALINNALLSPSITGGATGITPGSLPVGPEVAPNAATASGVNAPAAGVTPQTPPGMIDKGVEVMKNLPSKALDFAKDNPGTVSLAAGALLGGGSSPAEQARTEAAAPPPAIAGSDFTGLNLGVRPSAQNMLKDRQGRNVFNPSGGLILSNLG